MGCVGVAFITETQTVFFAVRNEYLNVIRLLYQKWIRQSL
jgi:hypothetical protein